MEIPSSTPQPLQRAAPAALAESAQLRPTNGRESGGHTTASLSRRGHVHPLGFATGRDLYYRVDTGLCPAVRAMLDGAGQGTAAPLPKTGNSRSNEDCSFWHVTRGRTVAGVSISGATGNPILRGTSPAVGYGCDRPCAVALGAGYYHGSGA